MIPRYALPEMTAVWSDERKFEMWLKVEIAVAQAWGDEGVVPSTEVRLIEENARVHVPDVMRYIEETHHDVTAFLRSVADSLGPESRWIHYGLTSNDVWDTATCLQMLEALDLIDTRVKHLREVIARRAVEHKDTLCIGRTHGVHAEPTTFGMKLAVWVDELRRQEERIALARQQIAVGQMSGPVGTHASVPPSVEENACKRLGLDVAKVTTQVIQRDRHAFYMSVIAGIGASLEKFATEIRGLQRTDILEAEEPFDEGGQTGSSSMPHKRNPELCERVCGIARTLRGYATTGLENVALWHERDISHSSAERIILPDATGLLDYALHIFTGVMDGLVVYPERMARNLEKTQGLIYSSKVLNALIESGLKREAAYDIVKTNSMRAWREEVPYRSLLDQDERVTERLDARKLDAIFDPRAFLTHTDESFRRLGLI
ncbi:MAG: adenylosuccinate lyase [Chloroflexi bacterium]|nr:adenylosuccinate lyase [Chloroflexota bacterium]MQC47962.1 adenylosuccinate lyase [Chloroflexota bacterium]